MRSVGGALPVQKADETHNNEDSGDRCRGGAAAAATATTTETTGSRHLSH